MGRRERVMWVWMVKEDPLERSVVEFDLEGWKGF